MQPVAVGRFCDDEVRLLDVLRIADDGLVGIPDIAGEDDLFRLPALVQEYLDAGGAEKMPRVDEAHVDPFADLDKLSVIAGAKHRNGRLRVVHGIHRLDRVPSGAFCLSGEPFRVALLDMRAVTKHDLAQAAGRIRGINRPCIAVFEQKRDISGVVDMRVGQKDKFDFCGVNGDALVDENILALLHPAIDKPEMPADLDHGTAAGNLMGRAQKCQLHSSPHFLHRACIDIIIS